MAVDQDPPELSQLTAELKRTSTSPEGKARLAVLMAIRQAIVERGGTPSCAAYAAGLMSSLSQQHDEDTTAAVVYVLSHVLQHVSQTVLRSKFIAIADLLLATMQYHDGSAAVARHGLHCVHLIMAVQEVEAWRTPQMGQLTEILLSHAVDPRPKVRKAAQGYIMSLIGQDVLPGEARAAIESKALSFCASTFKACTSADTVSTQQLLGMVQELAPSLSNKARQSLVLQLAKLISPDDKTMLAQVLNALETVLKVSDGAGIAEKHINKAISAALEVQPQLVSDSSAREAIKSFLAFLSQALERLHATDAAAAAARLPDVFAAVSDFLLPRSDGDELAVAGANLMCDLIDVCVQGAVIDEAHRAALAPARGAATPLERTVEHVQALLQPNFRRSAHCVLCVVQSLLNRLHASASPLLDALVVQVLAIARDPRSLSPAGQDEVQHTMGAIVANVGPEQLLALAPLFPSMAAPSLTDRNNTWLLPALKKHVRSAPLAFWVQHLLPVADVLQQQAIAADAAGRPVQAKNLMLVHHQLWSLLPAFCLDPTDLPSAFPPFAKRLGISIEQEPELRGFCCAALANATRSCRTASSGSGDTEMGDEEGGGGAARGGMPEEEGKKGLRCLAGFAKNYLPILFNAASQVQAQERVAVLEAIGEYALVTERGHLNQFFQNVMKKLLSAASEQDSAMADGDVEEAKALLLDLALALMPALDAASAEFLYKAVVPFLQDAAGGVQKRAYKLLQQMSEHHLDALQRKIADLQQHLVQALGELLPAAAKWRLRCISRLCQLLPLDAAYLSFLQAILGEVILGTKQAAKKTRECSFSLLVLVAERLEGGGGATQLKELFAMLLAGLAGTTNHMVSASILALSRLTYEYADRVGELAPELLDTIAVLFQSKSREIVTSALGFAKVAAVALPPALLRQYLEGLIASLVIWSSDSRNRFRLKVKVIVERLMRRTSYEEVLAATPEEHKKLAIAVHKRLKRVKNLKARGKEGAQEEGAEGEEGEGRLRLKGGYEAALYGEEDSEEEEEMGSGDEGEAMEVSGGGAGRGRRGIAGGKGTGGQGEGGKREVQTKFGFPATKEGRPVILEEGEGERDVGKKRKRHEEDAEDVIRPMEVEKRERRAVEEIKAGIQAGQGSGAEQAALADVALQAQAERGERGWDQVPNAKRRRRAQPESRVLGGVEFKPKKAGVGGDVKKAGRPDPFAYVPLDKRMLNRRKKRQPVKALSNVLYASKRSAGVKRQPRR